MNNERLILFTSLEICCIASTVLVSFGNTDPRKRQRLTQSLPDAVHGRLAIYHENASVERPRSGEQTLRTIHDDLHIIHKAVDHFEYLGRSHTTFLLSETVQPPENSLNLALS